MLSKDIRAKIKQIEIYTRRLLNSSLVGDSRSAVKGSGFEFDQIREYQLGDDIRFIDWNGTARMNKFLVKEYIEERDRTLMLVVDISASKNYSSTSQLKRDVAAQVASVLSLVADYGKDQVGLLLFSDQVELYIPPNRGSMHVRSIMEAVFSHQSHSEQTNVNAALSRVAALPRRDTLVLLISDFIDADMMNASQDRVSEKTVTPVEKMLRHLAKRHELIAVRCLDGNEITLPDVGFLTIEDPETGQLCDVDTRNKKELSAFLGNRLMAQNALFKRCGVDCVDVAVDRPFVGDLIRFFRRRMMY